MNQSRFTGLGLLLTILVIAACKRDSGADANVDPVATSDRSDAAKTPGVPRIDDVPTPAPPRVYEVTAEDLLAMRLPDERSAQGWVRLFDGHTLFGWEITGGSDWKIIDGAIVADGGTAGLLCTSIEWKDFELSLQFSVDDSTNSGVFLRTPVEPENVATDCYEINIAPDDDPYPTGGIARRQTRTTPPPKPDGDWQTMTITARGGTITVGVDETEVCRLDDPNPVVAGRIGLQYRTGRIAFRDIQLRPLGMNSMIDPYLSSWKRYPEMDGEFRYDDGIVVDGGKTQLESKQRYGDFTLMARYQLAADDTNTGIFFRCIPGDEMMGYECQVNDGFKNNNPLEPSDCGTGGIFRRQNARVIAGRPATPNSLMLRVADKRMAAWVNGLQVSNFYDDRPPNENPRRGSRIKAGTVIIQGHDPATKATFGRFEIAE